MKNQLLALSSNAFIQGGVSLIISNFLIGFLNYSFNFLAGRSLGPSGYSEITALFSYLTILSVPVAIITSLTIKRIGSYGEKGYSYAQSLEEWFYTKLKKWWLFGAFLLVAVPFLPSLTNLDPLSAYILLPLLLLSFFSAFYDSLNQGLHLFTWFAVVAFTSTIIKLMGAGAAYTIVPEIWIVLTFLILSGVVQLTFSRWVFRSHVIQKNADKLFINKRIISVLKNRELIITTISILSITLLNNIDIIFAKKYLSAHEAGVYASWSLFAKIVFYVIGPIINLSFVFFSSKKHEGLHKRAFVYSVGIMAAFGVCSFIGYSLLGEFIVLTLFGSSFREVIPYLTLASVFGTLYMCITYFNNYSIAKGSNNALIIPIFIPFFIGSLFLFGNSIYAIMLVNITFVGLITLAFSLLYARRYYIISYSHDRQK